ncbi:Uncharacterised protein [Mycobacteroides abscessus subsp. abscessus]|nr:Uncharacterised protein [Mycobacteroides abscessus subsp. abscessus]
MGEDVVGGGETDDVEDLERAHRGAGGDAPGLVDGLGLGVPARGQCHPRAAVPITSAVLNFHTWLAKCRARNRSGRPVKSLMSLGSSVEELVAKIVRAGASSPRRR